MAAVMCGCESEVEGSVEGVNPRGSDLISYMSMCRVEYDSSLV